MSRRVSSCLVVSRRVSCLPVFQIVLDLKVAPSQLSRFPTAAWVSQLYTITEAILELRKFMLFCTFKIQRKTPRRSWSESIWQSSSAKGKWPLECGCVKHGCMLNACHFFEFQQLFIATSRLKGLTGALPNYNSTTPCFLSKLPWSNLPRSIYSQSILAKMAHGVRGLLLHDDENCEECQGSKVLRRVSSIFLECVGVLWIG